MSYPPSPTPENPPLHSETPSPTPDSLLSDRLFAQSKKTDQQKQILEKLFDNASPAMPEVKKEYTKLLRQFDHDVEAIRAYLHMKNPLATPSPLDQKLPLSNETNILLKKYILNRNSLTIPQYGKLDQPLRQDHLTEPWRVNYQPGEEPKIGSEEDPVLKILPRLNEKSEPKTYYVIPPPGPTNQPPYYLKFRQKDPRYPLEGKFVRLYEFNLDWDKAKEPTLQSGAIIQEVPAKQAEAIADITEQFNETAPNSNESQKDQVKKHPDSKKVSQQLLQNIIQSKTEQTKQSAETKTDQTLNKEVADQSKDIQVFEQINQTFAPLLKIDQTPNKPALINISEKNQATINAIVILNNEVIESLKPDESTGQLTVQNPDRIGKIIQFLIDTYSHVLKSTKKQTDATKEAEKTPDSKQIDTTPTLTTEKLLQSEAATISETELFYDIPGSYIEIFTQTKADLEAFKKQYFSFD